MFFGPDTYRFCALLRAGRRTRRAWSTSAAAAARAASRLRRRARSACSRTSTRARWRSHASTPRSTASRAEIVASDVLAGVSGEVDLVIANPPLPARRRRARVSRGWRRVRRRRCRCASCARRWGGCGRRHADRLYRLGDRRRRRYVPACGQRRCSRALGRAGRLRRARSRRVRRRTRAPGYAGVDRIAVVGLRARLR